MFLSFGIPEFLGSCQSVRGCGEGQNCVLNRTRPKAQVLGPRVALYLGHFLSVGLRVQRGLSEQGWMLFRGNTKLIVERVMPDLWGGGRNTMM